MCQLERTEPHVLHVIFWARLNSRKHERSKNIIFKDVDVMKKEDKKDRERRAGHPKVYTLRYRPQQGQL